MKFRFCGDGDCPDWVLAGIHSYLSVLSSDRLQSLCQIVVSDMLGQPMKESVFTDIFKEHNIGRARAKSAMAALKFVVSNAVRYRVSTEIFNNELQQLGLPKDHSNVICTLFDENFSDLRKKHLSVTLNISQLADIHLDESGAEGYTNVELTTNYEVYNGIVQDRRQHKLTIRNEDLKSLVSELEIARRLMKKYSA